MQQSVHLKPTGEIGFGHSHSALLYYPDNVHRVVDLKDWYWDVLTELRVHGFDLWDMLKGAIELAEREPSAHGYEFDVVNNTAIMIRDTYRLMVTAHMEEPLLAVA